MGELKVDKNIFIMGSVASGKNTLMDKISSYYKMSVLDSGNYLELLHF